MFNSIGCGGIKQGVTRLGRLQFWESLHRLVLFPRAAQRYVSGEILLWVVYTRANTQP